MQCHLIRHDPIHKLLIAQYSSGTWRNSTYSSAEQKFCELVNDWNLTVHLIMQSLSRLSVEKRQNYRICVYKISIYSIQIKSFQILLEFYLCLRNNSDRKLQGRSGCFKTACTEILRAMQMPKMKSELNNFSTSVFPHILYSLRQFAK